MEPTDVRNREKATDAIIAPASSDHAVVEGRIARAVDDFRWAVRLI
jgi:hypothetical protein